jgi:hypothetical protein
MTYDPYWRTLRQVAASMAGVAPSELPADPPITPETAFETDVTTPDPGTREEADDALAS